MSPMASVFPWADSTLPMSQRQQLLGAALVEGSPDIPTWLATRLPDLTSDQLVTLAAELCSQAKMVGEEKMAQWLRTASPKALGAAAQWLHADNPTN